MNTPSTFQSGVDAMRQKSIEVVESWLNDAKWTSNPGPMPLDQVHELLDSIIDDIRDAAVPGV